MKITISIQQSLISLSLNGTYTGTSGLYSPVYPTEKSAKAIRSLCNNRTVGHLKLKEGQHCTVMYCNTKAPPESKVLPFSKETYKAEAVKVEWWAGHDDKGYLVLQLESDDLQKEHARLVAAGCEATFEDYKPHITLASPYDLDSDDKKYQVKLINLSLRRTPLTLWFNNQGIEDIKKD